MPDGVTESNDLMEQSMKSFGRFKISDFTMPALCVALVLFMTAQLVIITVLGMSFKGVKQFSTGDRSPGKATEAENAARTKKPPRQLSAKSSLPHLSSASVLEIPSEPPKHVPLLNNPTSWPPVESRLYPDMELYNQDGKLTRLSDFSGNVIIVQPVAMSCPLSQAYSGANKKGKTAFKECFPNNSVIDFPTRMQEYTGISMNTPGLVFVQILLYNLRNEPPSIEDARQWANHFDLRTSNNQYVLVATPEMVTRKSALLIPGFQLIDRSFILCSDSSGILPKRNLYLHFFPTLQNVLQVPQVSDRRVGAPQGFRTLNSAL